MPICGIDRIRSSNTRLDRGSCRVSVAVTYPWSGKPAAAASTSARITRMTPDSFSRRTRCRVAAGDSPVSRASSTLVRSASSGSAVSSWTSTSSSETATVQNFISLMTSTGKYCTPTGEYGCMNINRRHAVAALIAAGLLWGTTVPLSKLALEWLAPGWLTAVRLGLAAPGLLAVAPRRPDRESTRLNSSHSQNSYAVFCLEKKKTSASPTTNVLVDRTLSHTPTRRHTLHALRPIQLNRRHDLHE